MCSFALRVPCDRKGNCELIVLANERRTQHLVWNVENVINCSEHISRIIYHRSIIIVRNRQIVCRKIIRINRSPHIVLVHSVPCSPFDFAKFHATIECPNVSIRMKRKNKSEQFNAIWSYWPTVIHCDLEWKFFLFSRKKCVRQKGRPVMDIRSDWMTHYCC